MKITKYEHACFIVEEQGKRLVVDPGVFTHLPDDTSTIGLVVTHVHDDHITPENESKLREANSDLAFISTQEVAEKFIKATAADTTKTCTVGPFNLNFFGKTHQPVHPDYPAAQNVGVLINDTIYYPGDSFTMPHKPVKVALVPAAAPWMKTAEAMNFIAELKPEIVIPTHYGVLSNEGSSYTDNWLKQACEKAGAQYKRLQTGESLEV